MRLNHFARLMFFPAAAAMSLVPAMAQGGGQKAPPPPMAITQLKPGLYEVTGFGGNTSVRVTNDAVLVADTKNLGEENYNQLVGLIRTVTQAPIRFAVITHVHQDHSGNTASFLKNGAQVYAHQGEKAALATYTSAAGKPAEPSNVYAKDQTLMLGAARVELHNYGPAHTGGDTIVHFPDLRVVHGGDVVVGNPPNCDFANGGSATNWTKVMDEILKLDFDTLVPGHGNVMTRAEVEAYAQKWKTFVARATEAVKNGTPKEGLLAAIKVDDIGWNTASYGQPGRLDPFYAELQRAAR